jgi:hypothetical protein
MVPRLGCGLLPIETCCRLLRILRHCGLLCILSCRRVTNNCVHWGKTKGGRLSKRKLSVYSGKASGSSWKSGPIYVPFHERGVAHCGGFARMADLRLLDKVFVIAARIARDFLTPGPEMPAGRLRPNRPNIITIRLQL